MLTLISLNTATAHLTPEQIVMVIAIGYVAHAVLAKGRGSECVPAIAVDLRCDAAAEGERGEGVVVCEQDHGVDQLCQGPAVFLCLQKALRRRRKKGKTVSDESQIMTSISLTFQEVENVFSSFSFKLKPLFVSQPHPHHALSARLVTKPLKKKNNLSSLSKSHSCS